MDPSRFEDMHAQHRRFSRKNGTQDACTLAAERGLPKTNADGAELAKYQAERTDRLTGGYDPLAIIRNPR